MKFSQQIMLSNHRKFPFKINEFTGNLSEKVKRATAKRKNDKKQQKTAIKNKPSSDWLSQTTVK
jgi:hypothetical protein